MLARTTWLVPVVLAALSGCGGSDAGPAKEPAKEPATAPASAPPAAAAPKAAQPIAALVPQLERFGARGNCSQVLELVHPADLPDPTGGASAGNCEALRGLIATLRGLKATDSAEFGTAAIIDGSTGGRDIALVAALDPEKSFKLSGVYVPRHQIGTHSASGDDFKAPAKAFLEGLRSGDCKAARAALAPVSRLDYANEKQFCSFFARNYLAPGGMGARLRADRGAALIDLGGTRDQHFYGIATQPAGYRTIVVGTLEGGGTRVTDVLPVER